MGDDLGLDSFHIALRHLPQLLRLVLRGAGFGFEGWRARVLEQRRGVEAPPIGGGAWRWSRGCRGGGGGRR